MIDKEGDDAIQSAPGCQMDGRMERRVGVVEGRGMMITGITASLEVCSTCLGCHEGLQGKELVVAPGYSMKHRRTLVVPSVVAV